MVFFLNYHNYLSHEDFCVGNSDNCSRTLWNIPFISTDSPTGFAWSSNLRTFLDLFWYLFAATWIAELCLMSGNFTWTFHDFVEIPFISTLLDFHCILFTFWNFFRTKEENWDSNKDPSQNPSYRWTFQPKPSYSAKPMSQEQWAVQQCSLAQWLHN